MTGPGERPPQQGRAPVQQALKVWAQELQLRPLPAVAQAQRFSVESVGIAPSEVEMFAGGRVLLSEGGITPFGTHNPWKMMVLTNKGERAFVDLLQRCPAA